MFMTRFLATRRMLLWFGLAYCTLGGPLFSSVAVADNTVTGDQVITGDLTVEGNLTVQGDLVVKGRIIATGATPPAKLPDVFVRLWELDQHHNGLAVTLRDSDGAWDDRNADIGLDEQQESLDPRNDRAPLPMLVIHDDRKLSAPTYQTVKLLFDNYQLDDRDAEDALGTNATEDNEVDAFLEAAVATEVMEACRAYINEQHLGPGGADLSPQQLKQLLKHQWFELYANHFSSRKDDCSGFEHVFVGERSGNKIGGHHFWWKYYLEQEAGTADSLGHKYNGPRGETYPWIATFRMSWSPEANTNLNEPKQKGFFVGCSPELMLAYGTLGLLWETKNAGTHPVVTLAGGRFELTVHANTLPGAGDPDDRRGDRIRSVFPILRSVTTSGGSEGVSVADALAMAEGSRVQVTGMILDAHNEEFGLQLADTADTTRFLAVKLPKSFRPEFNPLKSPGAKGRTIVVHGRRGRYTGIDGLVDVTHVEFVD